MLDLNEALIIGRLGRDPEQRSFQSGGSVVSMSVATNRSWKDKTTNEWKSVAHWHTVVIFDTHFQKLAMQHLRKGSRVLARGAVEYRRYAGRDGQERQVTEIVLHPYGRALLILLDRDGSDGAAREGGDPAISAPAPARPAPSAKVIDLDDEIPF